MLKKEPLNRKKKIKKNRINFSELFFLMRSIQGIKGFLEKTGQLFKIFYFFYFLFFYIFTSKVIRYRLRSLLRASTAIKTSTRVQIIKVEAVRKCFKPTIQEK